MVSVERAHVFDLEPILNHQNISPSIIDAKLCWLVDNQISMDIVRLCQLRVDESGYQDRGYNQWHNSNITRDNFTPM